VITVDNDAENAHRRERGDGRIEVG